MKKIVAPLLVLLLFFVFTFIYFRPMFQGLVPLALDLLISRYSPWYSPATILLKNSYLQDSIIQLYPWKHFVFQSFKEGIVPFWNPYQMMGMPFMASFKPMVFYPLNILYLLGEIPAWNILLFLQVLLSFIFSYILARDFKIKAFPSLLVSLAFALNSLMMGVLEFGSEGHVLLWFPLFLFATKRYLETQKGRYLGVLSFSIACSILAGQLQYTAYLLLATAGFICYYGRFLKTNITTYSLLFLSIALGIGVSSIQLIPGIELFAKSYRGLSHSYEVFGRGLIFPDKLFRLFSPDFFGNPVNGDLRIGYIEASGYFGIIPLFFAFYAALNERKNIFVKFFTWVAVLSGLFCLQGIGPLLYFLHIPLITSGEANRLFSLVLFSGAILSGFGLTGFLEKTKKRNILNIAIFVGLFLVALIWGAFTNARIYELSQFISNVRFNVLIFSLFLVGAASILLVGRKKTLLVHGFLLLIVLLTFVDLFRMGYRFTTFSNTKFLYPPMGVISYTQKESAHTLARVQGLAEPEIPTYLHVQSIETYNTLYLQRSALLLQALQGKPTDLIPGNKYQLSQSLTSKRAFDFLGVSLVVVKKDVNPSIELFNSLELQTAFTPVYRDDRYVIYKNNDVFPRFSLYYQYKALQDDKDILKAIGKNSLDFKNEVLLEENLPVQLKDGQGEAKLISSNANMQIFSIQTDQPALFYISDTYFPGWSAKINNMPTKIYRANYNFRAVLVPTGTSTLVFSYLPQNYYLAMTLSLLSIVAVIGITLFSTRKGK
jgi:hypothetical protein